jgi:hypothetical protein
MNIMAGDLEVSRSVLPAPGTSWGDAKGVSTLKIGTVGGAVGIFLVQITSELGIGLICACVRGKI